MKPKAEQKIVSPLQALLMNIALEELFAFLHRTKLHFVLVREHKRYEYKARIFEEGMLSYEASSPHSLRAALADALAKFLTNEKKDFHDY